MPRRKRLTEGVKCPPNAPTTSFQISIATPVQRAPRLGCSPEGRLGVLTSDKSRSSWITNGSSNKEIAAALGVGMKTVEAEVTHILRRFEVPTRLDAAVIWALLIATGNNESLNASDFTGTNGPQF